MDALIHNNVVVKGEGSQPMLFSYGYGCDQHMWRFINPAFEEAYQTVLYDLTGFGKSDLSNYDKARYSSLEDYARDVVEFGAVKGLQRGKLTARSFQTASPVELCC